MDNFIGQSVEKQVGKMEYNTQEINQNTGERGGDKEMVTVKEYL